MWIKLFRLGRKSWKSYTGSDISWSFSNIKLLKIVNKIVLNVSSYIIEILNYNGAKINKFKIHVTRL